MRLEQLIELQARMHSHAHRESLELKPLGYAIERQGLDASRPYADLEFSVLPWESCPHLSSLDAEQRNIISAMFFANFYSRVAAAEMLAIESNLRIAEQNFERASDGWMVLFNETAEELDHVACFRTLYRALTQRDDFLSPDRHRDMVGLRRFHSRIEGMELDAASYAAIVLSVRYLLNLTAKQVEAHLFEDIREEANPLALEITEGHRTDEARHLTTSIEMATHLMDCAERPDLVQLTVAIMAKGLVEDRFCDELSPDRFHAGMGVDALRLGRHHPRLTHLPEVDEWVGEWNTRGLRARHRPRYERSQRWIGERVADLESRMGLDLEGDSKAFARWRDSLDV